jgi:hypothetical protein
MYARVVGPTADEPCIKGAVLREMLIWYVTRFGRVEADRLFRSVPPEHARLLHRSEPAFGILSTNWYPMSLLRPVLDAAVEGLPDEGRAIAREANATVVPRMIRGVYKVLFDMAATPERYARHVPKMWHSLHTTGRRSMSIRAPGEALSVVEDWPGHHPLICWAVIYTMAYLFQAMGYKTWEVERVACVAHGAARCETILQYRK